MKVMRVERHIIKKNHPMYNIIDEYCFKSKDLYNFSNYQIRQMFIKDGSYIDDKKLSKLIKHEAPFKAIGSNSGQQTMKMLHLAWKSFFASIKDYGKNPSKYLGRPQLPKYLPKNGRYVWVLTNVQSKIVDGYLKFSFKPLHPFNKLIMTKATGKHMQTRFIPKGEHYVLEIVYEKEIIGVNDSEETKRIIGIDLGLNRLITTQNNIGAKPIAINGGKIKAINNFYNKEIAKYQSKAKKINKVDWTKRLQNITNKRNYKIDYLLHCASKKIVEYCVYYNIDTVVIGYNKGWKQRIKIGRISQKFVDITFLSFVSKLEYKLEEIGIKLIKTEESYTSKASFLDGDKLTKGEFSGRRVKRGLYKSGNGTLINADVNGAGNIIKKVFPNAFAEGIKDVGLHPKIINL